MNYAIIQDEIVVNIVVSNRRVETNWIQVPVGAAVSIGDRYDGFMFYDPEGNPRLTPEMLVIQMYVKELELLKNAQIQALSDRNDFLEDCIAEMAGMIYA